MELKILEPVKINNPKNIFKLQFKVMHGDGDGYTEEEWGFKENEKEDLITIIKAFEIMLKLRSGYEDVDYPNVPGFKELMEEEWPLDYTSDSYPATLQNYEVFYFNNEGIKHNVKVEK